MQPAISLSGLRKSFGDTQALRGIDLEVERGRIFGFLGPNGAGKTTTIRIMLDLIRPDAGQARVLDLDCQRQSVEVRRRCGYTPGDLRLYEGMRGDEFLDFIETFRPEKRDAAYRAQLVERLGLDLQKRVRALSKGNRQKLGLIQAMMHRPDVLVLDEPTSGLDPLVQEEVVRLLEEATAEGRSVFFSSHVLSEVERICHAVAIIREGRIVAVEDIAQVKSRSVHIVEVTFAGAPPPALFSLPGVRVLRHDGSTIRLQVRDGIDAVIKAIATQRVLDVRTEQPNLEDVFLAYYTDAPRPDEDAVEKAAEETETHASH